MSGVFRGIKCIDCQPGRVCSFHAALLAAERQEAKKPALVQHKLEPKDRPEREDGCGRDVGYDYSRGEYRVPRKALR
ncbi:MAG TPA: hypothetical protein VIM33_06450 [Gaiellaceae bacterium]